MPLTLGKGVVDTVLAQWSSPRKTRLTRHVGTQQRRHVMTQEEIIVELKKMLSQRLRVAPERVAALAPDSPLLRDGLGLDSLDCIELLLGLEDEFGLTFNEDAEEGWIEHFSSLEKISQLVLLMKNANP